MDMCGWGRACATRYAYGVGSVGTGGLAGPCRTSPRAAVSSCGATTPASPAWPHATATVAALKRGMRLIVIDPRRAGLASKADIWLRVRPGTDGALALGLANLMIQHGWYDADFMRAWSNGPLLVRADTGRMLTARDLTPDGERASISPGTQRLHARWRRSRRAATTATQRQLALDGEYRIATTQGEVVCQPAFALYAALCRRYPPEVVEATCWIPRAQLEEAARLLWQARPVSYYAWSGHEHHANVTQTARAMALLYALTGCFDAPGGNVLLPAVPSAPITGEDLPAAQQRPPALGRRNARSGPRAGTSSPPANCTGRFWRARPIRCAG